MRSDSSRHSVQDDFATVRLALECGNDHSMTDAESAAWFSAPEAFKRLEEQLHTAERRLNGPHEFTKAGPGDFVGHDGWECGEGCDACYFAAKWFGLKEQLETLDDALRDILDIVEGWTPKMDPDVRIGRIGAYATEALKAAKRVSNPASELS